MEVVHFISDGPSSQYKNQFNFIGMAEKLPDKFPDLKCFVWNFSVAGHGKGAADGVGGVLKRTVDKYVVHGNDVDSEETFLEVVKARVKGWFLVLDFPTLPTENSFKTCPNFTVSGVWVTSIPSKNIEKMKEVYAAYRGRTSTFVGIMNYILLIMTGHGFGSMQSTPRPKARKKKRPWAISLP